MNYNEAIHYLENCHRFGSKQGHTNFKNLMALFGEPQKKLKVIHIAGTNGKGSTCSMITSVLNEQGYKVGLFTSPHLEKYNERISISGECISDFEFAKQVELIKEKVFELFNGSDDYFSFFEIITAIAFNYFFKKNVDYVVLEVGLGGRLDSTNIIENPLVSVITSISFDHTEYLGNTISEIAKEKGGIIKQNSPVSLYLQDKEVYNVIKDICDEKNSELFYLQDYGVKICKQNFDGTIFSVENEYFHYENLEISLFGEYQVYNACNVLMTIEILKRNGVFISDNAIFNGLKKAKISGRMEVVSREPLFILEGAHNVGGTIYLNSFLKKLKSCNKKITIVIGILKDKNYIEMLQLLTEFSDNIIFTEVNSERAIKADNLLSLSETTNKKVFNEEDFKKAIDLAFKISDKNDCIICTGSLYLVGDVLKYIKQEGF